MTAELIMPTLPGDHQPHAPNLQNLQNLQNMQSFQSNQHQHPQRPPHMRSLSYQVPAAQNLSPLSTSDESMHNASVPASPKAQHARQNRPMYMPAVLRPNSEFSQKLTRANTEGHRPGCEYLPSGRRLSNGLMAVPGMNMIQRLGRRTTGDDAKQLEGLDPELFPAVTDVPTRQHWKPDPDATICDDPTCKRTFNYFVRRHHCRRCGNIFCDPHSRFEVPLDQDANFNPRASPSRTCNHCFDQFRVWHSRNNSQSSSSASSDAQNATPPTPIHTMPEQALGQTKPGPEVPNSVPRDWNWSTF